MKYGFQMQESLPIEVSDDINAARSTTFMVHQVRHLLKVMGSPKETIEQARASSAVSMTTHNANYVDLAAKWICPTFVKGIKEHILGDQ